MKLVLILLLISSSARGEVIAVRDGYIRTFDSDVAIQVRGGAYLTDKSLIATAKELAALRARNKELTQAAPEPTNPATVVSVTLLIVTTVAGIVSALKTAKVL